MGLWLTWYYLGLYTRLALSKLRGRAGDREQLELDL